MSPRKQTDTHAIRIWRQRIKVSSVKYHRRGSRLMSGEMPRAVRQRTAGRLARRTYRQRRDSANTRLPSAASSIKLCSSGPASSSAGAIIPLWSPRTVRAQSLVAGMPQIAPLILLVASPRCRRAHLAARSLYTSHCS